MAFVAVASLFRTDKESVAGQHGEDSLPVPGDEHMATKANRSEFGSWLAEVFDVKCCTMRDRPDVVPHCQPSCQPQQRMSGTAMSPSMPLPKDSASGQERHLSDILMSEMDASNEEVSEWSSMPESNGSSREFDLRVQRVPHHVPKGLIEKIAVLVGQNPYMMREIGEHSSKSRRLQFLQSCALRRLPHCDKLWSGLSQRDRLDFLQLLRMQKLGTNVDSFFLNMMEPDDITWREEKQDWQDDTDMKSDSGSAGISDMSTASSDGSPYDRRID
jgi:hypothetical protein